MIKRLLLISASIFLFGSVAYAQTSSIVVKVSGLNNFQGIVALGLYLDNNTFPIKGKEFMGGYAKADAGTVVYTFHEVPHDIYAVAVFHDSDLDGKLDTNAIGIPTEGYAFSNNEIGLFGTPPEFKDASFKLIGNLTLEIKMNY